jgi:hypothetical protein
MNAKANTLALALFVASTSGLAQSASQGPEQAPPPADLRALDDDQDGAVSINEATGNMDLSIRFVDLDADGDGELNQAEFSRFEVQPSQE